MASPAVYAPRAPLPLGVAILAILIGLVGLIFLIAGILILVGVGLLGDLALYGTGLIAGLILVVFGIILLVVASGLWRQEMWALALAILVILVALASNVYNYLGGRGASLLVVVIEGLLLVYLIAVSNRFR